MSDSLFHLEDKDKVEILKLLLEENNKQLVFWRERNWVALRDTVAGLLAVAGVSQLRPNATNALVTVAIALAVFATIYLHKNFQRYLERRSDGARIEEALSLYVRGVFLPTDSLLPETYKNSRADRRGSYIFIGSIWVIAAAISWGLLCAS